MQWYYAADNKQMGPVDEAAFKRLVETGAVAADTLVWHEGMAEWQAYGKTHDQPAPAQADAGGTCSECGRLFAADQLLVYENRRVCATCKPLFFQRLKEGADVPGEMVYGGFWIRVGAKVIDQFILNIAAVILQLTLGVLVGVASGDSEIVGVLLTLLMAVINVGIVVGYSTWFVGRFGATPGKMACGLKVVTANGGLVSYPRALGRAFAEMLSGCPTLLIGYIMAAGDDEKRTLHDRICDTRVVKKGG